MSGNQIEPPFSQGFGYGYIIGVGALFAIGMCVVSWGLSHFFAEKQTSEMFMTGKRSVKIGLTASAVVSSWTTAATMLTSTTEGYLLHCVLLYGAGASVQILLFSVAVIELKRKAPNTHTLLEFVPTRYGAAAHCVLGFYSLFFICVMGINLLVGGSVVFATLTGMNQNAAWYYILWR
ncbi:hypothetical protein Z517_04933 [Fonsecaea pedrosoi CBS 271.37]|uniref:Amino acid permease/ SLC12A domain-containing protein n=1 Tax=Fonsecaea pedrosoi CBS 271.37 TaxID=1442368 RepID=A0A0D2F5D1_9EURO|nr:uncharacterized protein Z517_04933 [Fonsecaea pedrosoi CBS 271.37]KIW81907.1 hypothetical protein Z517_04933 [Fonsecaea pedrosoi CBS 271.37]